MPTIELPGLMTFPEPGDISVTSTSIQFQIAGDYCATRILIPLTGTITGLKFLTAGVTTGCTLRFGLEGDGGAIPARPSGTYLGGGTAYGDVVITTTSNALYTVTFGTPLAATKGDFLWLTGRIQSGTPSALTIRTNASVDSMLDPFLVKLQNGVLTTTANLGMNHVLTYQGVGDVHTNRQFVALAANISPSSGGAVHESGARILTPSAYGMRTDGFIFRVLSVTANTVGEVLLYDAADNVLASYSVPNPNIMIGTGGQFRAFWSTPVDLPRGEYVRLVWKHTGASTWTNGQQYQGITAGTAAPPWLANHHYTYRGPGGGAWTDHPTDRMSFPHVLTIDRLYLPDQSHQF